MTTLREAAQQALEAMSSFESGTNGLYEGEFAQEIAALRAALVEPVQEPQRKPLTEEEIRRIDDGTHFHESPDWSLRFARAIERAHGIGENT